MVFPDIVQPLKASHSGRYALSENVVMRKQAKGTIDLSEIKRGAFPGLLCKANCPVCQSEMVIDFSGDDDLIYYPEIGKEDRKTFTCLVCEEKGKRPFEWEVPLKIIEATIVVEYELPCA